MHITSRNFDIGVFSTPKFWGSVSLPPGSTPMLPIVIIKFLRRFYSKSAYYAACRLTAQMTQNKDIPVPHSHPSSFVFLLPSFIFPHLSTFPSLVARYCFLSGNAKTGKIGHYRNDAAAAAADSRSMKSIVD